MNFPLARLKPKHERRILSGHLWVFSNEIAQIDSVVETGGIVKVNTHDGRFCGYGFYNPNSLISIRIFNRSEIGDVGDVIKTHLRNALKLRNDLYIPRNSYRLVFSESDFLPGLIIDRYNTTFVLQINSAGMEKHIHYVIEFLQSEFDVENIFTKNEIHFRQLEGLDTADKIFLGSHSTEIIDDGKIKYEINFENSQKTGFYFDQSDNRFFIEQICRNKTVVDAFCNIGGFGLHAARGGAKKVYFVDSSSSEIESAKKNFELNEFDCEAEFRTNDAFDFLQSSIENNRQYDVVMLDPPAFAKNKKNLFIALKGYEKLNRLGLRCVSEGGYLVTSSCSFHVSKAEFEETIVNAARKEGKIIQRVHYNSAALDHPSLPAMNETSYLKFFVFRALN